MVNKKNLLSIGELSKITGVHIKALRYYDSLGILIPTYVDPDSGYRYYSFYHKALVDAIKFCVELDIPLNRFSEFTNDDGPWICYADLIEHGSTIIEEKIKVMQERLTRLRIMQAEIMRSEISYQSTRPQKYTLPARDCWITPYTGKQACEESMLLIKKLIMEIHRNGLHLGNESGLLLMRQKNQWKQYLFVDVSASENELEKYSQIIHIPKGHYLCQKVGSSDVNYVWNWVPKFVTEKQIQYVIETELFTGNYYFSNPVLELRCLLYD